MDNKGIIPAILSDSYSDIKEKVNIISEVSSWVQIDINDGIYVPKKTWPFIKDNDEDLRKLVHEETSLPNWEDVSYEFDLMVSSPRAIADTFVTVGASRIVVHFGSFKNEQEREVFIKDFKNKYTLEGPLSIDLGLAIESDVEIKQVLPLIGYLDFVQIMGIDHIGEQGQIFDLKTIDRIKELRSIAPDLIISVDGGVKEENIEALVSAGATRLIVGSQIWVAQDPIVEFQKLDSFIH